MVQILYNSPITSHPIPPPYHISSLHIPFLYLSLSPPPTPFPYSTPLSPIPPFPLYWYSGTFLILALTRTITATMSKVTPATITNPPTVMRVIPTPLLQPPKEAPTPVAASPAGRPEAGGAVTVVPSFGWLSVALVGTQVVVGTRPVVPRGVGDVGYACVTFSSCEVPQWSSLKELMYTGHATSKVNLVPAITRVVSSLVTHSLR